MATATRRVMGVVLTALGLVLATTGLVTLVTPGLGQQPRAVAPIELQPPVGPASPDTTGTPDRDADTPAVVAGAEEPAQDPVAEGSSPTTPADPDAGSADQAEPRDEVGAVVVEAPAPVEAGDERDPATAQAPEDDAPTPAEQAPAPADDPGTDDGEGEDDGGNEGDPNEVATRDDEPASDDDAPDDDDPDDEDDEDDDGPVARGRRGGEDRTPTRFTARAPSLDADHGAGGSTIDVPGLARGLADGADHPGAAKGNGAKGNGAKGHGTPWTARGR